MRVLIGADEVTAIRLTHFGKIINENDFTNIHLYDIIWLASISLLKDQL